MRHEKEAIIKVQQGGRFSTLARGAAALAGLGLCAGVYTQVRNWEFPSWDAPSISLDVGDPKQAADDIMAGISQREAEPLYVDPQDVILGKISSIDTFGSAERPVTVLKAEKKYNSWLPQADEWVNLSDGRYMAQAFVVGPAQVRMGSSNDLHINLEAPKTNQDIRVVQNPRVKDDPQIVAELGQIPGGETSVSTAIDELHNFVLGVQESDKELLDVAACTAVRNTTMLAQQLLTAAGKEVSFQKLDIPNAVAYENPQLVAQHVVLRVSARGIPLNDGFIGPRLPEYTLENCQAILAKNTAVPDNTTQTLSQVQFDKVKLRQENK